MSSKSVLMKYVLCLALISMAFLAFINMGASSCFAAETYVYGDISGDNIVDSADYTIMRRYLIGLISQMPGANWKITSDVNGDGLIDSGDFTLLRRYLLGIIDKFPVNALTPTVKPTATSTPKPTSTPTTRPSNTPTPYPTSAGKPIVYIAGDSTVQTYTTAYYPQQGWGQRISEFFTTDVTFVNKAIGGRSSKSFIDEGRLAEILKVIKPGDYLLCQWGINDRYTSDKARYTNPSTTFRTYLKMYIDGAKAKGAIPVILTPTVRVDYANGVFQNGFKEYCNAAKIVATETDTKFIDLQTKALNYMNSIGYTKAIALYKTNDVLHFNNTGAYQMARLVSEGVKEINVPISKYVK